MKKYKYITIIEQQDLYEGKTVFSVLNNKSGNELAILYYYKPWKQYVFTIAGNVEGAVFNNTCLRDVIDFMESLTF